MWTVCAISDVFDETTHEEADRADSRLILLIASPISSPAARNSIVRKGLKTISVQSIFAEASSVSAAPKLASRPRMEETSCLETV